MTDLTTSDFDYPLDESLIAQQPLERRDQSRLLRLDRGTGRLSDHVFADLDKLLVPGDLLVLNDTRVIPARFFCRRASGGLVEGLFVRELPDGRWEAMLRKAGRCRGDERLSLLGLEAGELVVGEKLGGGLWLLSPRGQGADAPAAQVLERIGQTPLPPYIRHGSEQPQDRQRYQTVYASRAGAVAAPTAGLHFTPQLLASLAQRGVTTTTVTLHVGLGTFLPVKEEDIASHTMHSERFELSAESAQAINDARDQGRRVLAVGTTSVRVLETAARLIGPSQPLRAIQADSRLFLFPPAQFHVTDALITNFHLPRSTLLMLVAAFCQPGRTGGREMILRAYDHAQANRYRFFSYGDAMLIE